MPSLPNTAPLTNPVDQEHWRDRLDRLVDRWTTAPALQRWASSSILTRWLVRRRAERLFGVMAGFVHSQVLLGCVRLKLLEAVHASPRTPAQLAQLTGMTEAGLDRLLDSAVSIGLLERRSGGRLGLGPLGAPVVVHQGIRDMVEHNATLYQDLADPLALLRQPGDTRMNRLWPYSQTPQPDAAAEPVPANPSTGGADVFAHYSDLMGNSQRFVIDELLASYPFADHRHVLDVGGGLGGWVTALGQAHPHLALSLFDLPPVARLAAQASARNGLGDRLKVHGGSFIDDELPTGADLVTLLRVAHDHDDDTVRRLLRAIHRCLPMGGSLLLAEPMAGPQGEPTPTAPYYHFYLMAMGPGRLRTPEALTGLMQEAGFTHIEPVPNPMPIHARLLVGRKTRQTVPSSETPACVTFS